MLIHHRLTLRNRSAVHHFHIPTSISLFSTSTIISLASGTPQLFKVVCDDFFSILRSRTTAEPKILVIEGKATDRTSMQLLLAIWAFLDVCLMAAGILCIAASSVFMRHENVILSLFFSMAHLESESDRKSLSPRRLRRDAGTAGEEGVVKEG